MTECELFKVRAEHYRKPISAHPWQRTIKEEYSHRIKHCHNSLKNPEYPKDPQEQTKKRTLAEKFTVIGNRLTKEFIYCSNLVRGIYTYRRKMHAPPVIRGLTKIEWLEALRDLRAEYGGMTHCFEGEVAVLYNDKFLGGLKELKDLIETKFIYYVCANYRKEALNQFASYIKGSGRPCVYLHIAIDGKHSGTLIFMLYSDLVPRTCENFLRLCQVKRGGYSGTPVHRIVKDGWIQCGGYGLKSTDLDCENFAIPHDRRGVLCMANDGRHLDCSTQFFVLLQPAPWMAHKYVAFGQLIDGNNTLQKIEKVPTWYESPKKSIEICAAGILNLECQDIKINKTAYSYIQGHIENLVTVGEFFWELLMEKVFLELEFKYLAGEATQEEEQELEYPASSTDTKMRATKRFMHRKNTTETDGRSSQHSQYKYITDDENNDFDVEDYVYEPEESYYSYSRVSLAPAPPPSPSKPEKLFYIPLTDVPYPGEVDSTYDLKKFLKGDYCLESDLMRDMKPKKSDMILPIISDIYSYVSADDFDAPDEEELDSDEEFEIRRYLKMHGENVSFSGKVIRKMAKGAEPDIDNMQKQTITDECVRKVRQASALRRPSRRVSIVPPPAQPKRDSIVRRQTGFVRPEDLAKVRMIEKQDGDSDEDADEAEPNKQPRRKVSVAIAPEAEDKESHIKRRTTGFVRADDLAKIHVFQKSTTNVENYDDDRDEDDDKEAEPSAQPRRKVSVAIAPEAEDKESHIKRRTTGFVRAEDLAKIHVFQKSETSVGKNDDDEEDNKPRGRLSVRSNLSRSSMMMRRSVTKDDDDDDDDLYANARPSVIARLYDDVTMDDSVPTLKDYKSLSETQNKNPIFLTKATLLRDDRKDDSDKKGKTARQSIIYREDSYNAMQQKKVARKKSTDDVETTDQIDRKPENSLRTLEFARIRPTMTVSEYQQKNQRTQQARLTKVEYDSACDTRNESKVLTISPN